MRKVGPAGAKAFGGNALRIKGDGEYANPVGLIDACKAPVAWVF